MAAGFRLSLESDSAPHAVSLTTTVEKKSGTGVHNTSQQRSQTYFGPLVMIAPFAGASGAYITFQPLHMWDRFQYVMLLYDLKRGENQVKIGVFLT